MNTTKLKYTVLQEEIFRALCKTAGTKINQRTLAMKLRVTPAAITKALPRLEKERCVVITTHGAMNFKEIELNREDHRIIELKRAENLRALYASGLIEYLAEIFAGATIILFGSYGKGEDTMSSDIDIAVIGAKEKKLTLQTYESHLDRPIRMMYTGSFAELSKEFKENLFNGIILAGGITL